MIHWLQLGGKNISLKNEEKQWNNLKQYINTYKDSKITIYQKTTGDIFCRIIKLECNQNYNDLDLECNSGYNYSIKHFNGRPSNIELCNIPFEYFINRKFA
jgi:hypothetical protein